MGSSQIRYLLSLMIIAGSLFTIYSQVPERMYGSKFRESNRLLDLAKTEIDKTEYQQALVLLDKSLQYVTDNTDAYFHRAMVKEQLNNPDGALIDYQIVLLLDSTYREAAFNRAKLRYRMQQYEQSIGDFQKVLNMGSSGTQALYFKGTPLNQDGDVAIESISTTHGMDADIHNFIGLCYQGLSQHTKAINSFDQALLQRPDDANYFVNRGLSYVALGNSTHAIADFKSALILEPEHAIAQFNLTQEMEQSGSLDESTYDQIINENPQFTSAYVNRALVRLNSGDINGAIRDYSEAINIDPNDPILFLNRALAREKAGMPKSALADLNKALKLDTDNAKAHRSRGRVLFELKEYQLALQDMDDAIKLEPDFAGSYFNRALILRKMGNFNQTCADLNRAIGLGLKVAEEAFEAYCEDFQ